MTPWVQSAAGKLEGPELPPLQSRGLLRGMQHCAWSALPHMSLDLPAEILVVGGKVEKVLVPVPVADSAGVISLSASSGFALTGELWQSQITAGCLPGIRWKAIGFDHKKIPWWETRGRRKLSIATAVQRCWRSRMLSPPVGPQASVQAGHRQSPF